MGCSLLLLSRATLQSGGTETPSAFCIHQTFISLSVAMDMLYDTQITVVLEPGPTHCMADSK